MLGLSFRARLLLVVVAVAVVPLGLMGLWLTGDTARSGEELIRARMSASVEALVTQIGTRWVPLRSQLLFLTEDDDLHLALRGGSGTILTAAGSPPEATESVPATLQNLFANLDPAVPHASVHDRTGAGKWVLDRRPSASVLGNVPQGRTFAVALGIHDKTSGGRLGSMELAVPVSALIDQTAAIPGLAGMVLGVFEPSSGASLLPLPFDAQLLTADRFTWGGDEWVVVRKELVEPPLELVAAAPLAPFTQPFEQSARRGTWLVAIVALVGFLAAVVLTSRMTGSLQRLVAAADAVSRGDLARRVEDGTGAEVGHLAAAFNRMTDNLQRTLRQLADREALAAVGEFAASLAHEIRNPLTAIRIDLQRVEEQLPEDSPLRDAQQRALAEIERLDETVTRSLDLARSGRIHAETTDILEPLRAAIHAAGPAFDESGATLDLAELERTEREARRGDSASLCVVGDAGALEQVFLNVLLNAAQALGRYGSATVRVREEPEFVTISIRDTGSGIAAELLDDVFEPLVSTKPGGTGLGLPLARRITQAHGGTIRIDSVEGEGTTVSVMLPRCNASLDRA